MASIHVIGRKSSEVMLGHGRKPTHGELQYPVDNDAHSFFNLKLRMSLLEATGQQGNESHSEKERQFIAITAVHESA